MDSRDTQKRIARWVETRLGRKAMVPHERAMRFLEEALELAQALEVTQEEVQLLFQHVYAKGAGELKKEVGGVGTTLLVLCESCKVSFADCAERELLRIEKLPLHKFQKRQAQKAVAGIGAPCEP